MSPPEQPPLKASLIEAARKFKVPEMALVGPEYARTRGLFNAPLAAAKPLVAQAADSFKPVMQNAAIARILNQATARAGAVYARELQALTRLARDVFARHIPPLAQAMEGFKRRLDAMQDAERAALELLAPCGWLISPSLAMHAPEDMLSIVETEGIEALEEELVNSFNPEFCAEALSQCFDRPSYEAWRPKLERAMEAHRQGSYDLAIPIWLIALDGIARREFSTDESAFENLYRHAARKSGQQLQRRLMVNGSFAEPLLTALVRVIYLMSRDRDDTDASPALRRHGILHGEDPNFGTEKESIQCILVLEVLHLALVLAGKTDLKASVA